MVSLSRLVVAFCFIAKACLVLQFYRLVDFEKYLRTKERRSFSLCSAPGHPSEYFPSRSDAAEPSSKEP